jgi:hypothetical protein
LFEKRILYFEYFPAFKINKSHCSSEFLIFLFLNKIFVINAGIEPAFSVKFGNRTRIYIVLRESNLDCTNLREGDGRIWRKIFMEKNFFFILCMKHFYLGNRTLWIYLMMVKSFWGDNDVVLKYFCYWKL